MDDRRREKSDNHSSSSSTNYQRGWRQRSKNKRPPRYGGGGENNRSVSEKEKSFLGGDGKRSVPEWEKSFCANVGLIPWPRLLEAKKSMFLYQDILNWEDSACKEAFRNAKSWYWAKMKGLPCDHLKVSDPDIYIDEIDWQAGVDPDLLRDLERAPNTVRDQEHVNVGSDEVVILGLKEWKKPGYMGGETSGWGIVEKKPDCHDDQGWGDSNELDGWGDDDVGCDWKVCMTIEDDWNEAGWGGRSRDCNANGCSRGGQMGDSNGAGWGSPSTEWNEDGWGGPTSGWNEDDYVRRWDSHKQPDYYRKSAGGVNIAGLGWQDDGDWRKAVGNDNYYHNYNDKGARNCHGAYHQFDRGWKSATGNKSSGRKRVGVGYNEAAQTTWVDKKAGFWSGGRTDRWT